MTEFKYKLETRNSSFKPNHGVAQGSIVSPAFFNLYIEPLYWLLNKYIPLEDIFGYADDMLILCDSLETLQICINVIERWSAENKLIINKNKSAIGEFLNQKKKKTSLVIGRLFEGYPVVKSYKYLGTWLNQKLTLDTQLEFTVKKMNFILSRLCPSLNSTSLEFRKSIWQLFILPLYELGIPLYHSENVKCHKNNFEIKPRNSFRAFTGLRKSVAVSLLDNLMGYNQEERSQKLWYSICQEKGGIIKSLIRFLTCYTVNSLKIRPSLAFYLGGGGLYIRLFFYKCQKII